MSVEERSESIDSLQLDILIQSFERALKRASFRWEQDPELDYKLSSWIKPWVINFGTTQSPRPEILSPYPNILRLRPCLFCRV